MKPETALKAAIIEALTAIGCEVTNTPAGQLKVRRGYVHMAKRGWADITGYLPDGRFLGCEVKVPGAKTDKARAELQAAFREKANKAGCVAFVATSVDEAIEAVREAGRRAA